MSARRERRTARRPAPGAIPREPAAVAAAWLLAAALAGAALLVDVRAAEAFDAPKRLVALLGIAGAAGCMLGSGGFRLAVPTGGRRVVLGAFVAALAWTVVATLVSPRGAIARDGLRTLVLFALAAPLGASRVLAGGRANCLLAVFVAVVAIDAVASLAQAAGLELFATTAITGRTDTGAFLGNEGLLAQVTSLALVATVVLVMVGPTLRRRALAAGASGLLLSTLAVNRNLTALVTVAAGVVLALVLGRGRRARVPVAIGALALSLVVVGHAPLRARVADAVQAARAGDWDALTTYRLGPWAAALEMIRARPLTGYGPGTFGAEFTAQRLRAEVRQHRRFVIPLFTSNFGEAHAEYLQAAAEGGIPAALAAVVAMTALLAGLARIAADPADARHAEALLLVAVLGGAAIAAFTWFPLQRPASALPLLLAAGRGWRVLDPSAAAAERDAS